MKMTVESVKNGAVVTFHKEEGDEAACDVKSVYEFDEEEPEVGLSRLADMFYDMMEATGWNTNTKWGRDRVTISIQHGREYACEDKECVICLGEK